MLKYPFLFYHPLASLPPSLSASFATVFFSISVSLGLSQDKHTKIITARRNQRRKGRGLASPRNGFGILPFAQIVDDTYLLLLSSVPSPLPSLSFSPHFLLSCSHVLTLSYPSHASPFSSLPTPSYAFPSFQFPSLFLPFISSLPPFPLLSL